MATACQAKLRKRVEELEAIVDSLIAGGAGTSTDDQTLTLNGGNLTIEDGNTVTIAGDELTSLFGQDIGTLVNDS